MTILLSQVKIADTRSPFNGLVKDILIKDQQIASITDNYKGLADQTIQLKNSVVSPGFIDPFVHFCDPGMEHRETLTTGANAAIQGGFTTVFVVPNTAPVIDNKCKTT
jgi:dihydroorotase